MDTVVNAEQQKGILVFKSPFSGFIIPLEEVPDPVFAQKMVGDGLAIDPTSDFLLAPFDGEVIQIHPSHHALTLRHGPTGLEALIHIGLDTVQLKGEGFKVHVKKGDHVKAGDVLVNFDADVISRKAQSLISPLILLPGAQTWDFEVQFGPVEAGDPGFLVVRIDKSKHNSVPVLSSQSSKTKGEYLTSEMVKIPISEGIHARPASLILQTAKRFEGEISIHWENRQANCRSLVQILELAIPGNALVQFHASGPDAKQALEELARVTRELKEVHAPADNKAPQTASTSRLKEDQLGGVIAAPGIAAGQVVVVQHEALEPHEQGRGLEVETSALYQSMNKVRRDLKELEFEMKQRAGSTQAAIFTAHQDILDDPQIIESIEEQIHLNRSAAWAVNQVIQAEATRLSMSNNELIAARANDLLDVNRRWVGQLMGESLSLPKIPPNSILIADDLTPSDTASLDRSCVLGFCTRRGGSTSHVAILARSLDIPALAAIDPRALQLTNGTTVLLNANDGYLQLNPPQELLDQVKTETKNKLHRRIEEEAQAKIPALTTDKHRITVWANFANHEEADHAANLGAEGVGLMRSEFLFLNRENAPTEEEQFQIYTHMTKEMGPERPVTIRTLDVGGDKPLTYCPLPDEENPFLGERGIRMLLREQTLLRTQVRAVLRASKWGPLRIMIPMITNLEEVRESKRIIQEEADALQIPMIPVGIMIEVPAAVLIADHLAKEVDFFSIGTNDLTQYVLAMDRNHQALAKQVDALHPAVLKMIHLTSLAAHRAGIEVGVCGGLAGDDLGIPILLGLGIKELSVSLPSVPGVKALIRGLHLEKCKDLALRAMDMADPTAVRNLVKSWNSSC